RAIAFSNTPTVFGKELRCSFICPLTIQTEMSARFFTSDCRTERNRKERECHSRRTAVTLSRYGTIPGIRPTPSDPKYERATAFSFPISLKWSHGNRCDHA